MRREQLSEKLLDIKRARSWSWKYITGEIGGMSPVLVFVSRGKGFPAQSATDRSNSFPHTDV
jgi:hypothetical protein